MKIRETLSALMPCQRRPGTPVPASWPRGHDGISTSLSSPLPSPLLFSCLSPSLPHPFLLSLSQPLSFSSFSRFFKQESAWSQHHLEICSCRTTSGRGPRCAGKCGGRAAGEDEKPGAVKAAEGQAWGSHPSPCLPPPLLPTPVSTATAPTPTRTSAWRCSNQSAFLS